MITRRRLLEASGTAAVLAGMGRAFSQTTGNETEAPAAPDLYSQLPDGTRLEATVTLA